MIRDFVQTSLSAEALAELLTMAGFEVEDLFEVDGEPVFDIKVCSNRGDGLSALGLAREIFAKDGGSQPTELYQRAHERFPVGDEDEVLGLNCPVRIETDACDAFGCRGFKGVKNGDSPEWIQKRLTQAGMRPISLLVDLTNYVMLELGQPLHAYDLKKLGGPEIIVRLAKPGEKLRTLNGDEHTLKPNQMMICDATGPIGVAGVMGGETTEVDASTTEVLLEAAHFSNTSVRRTRKELGLSTEASYRFERSVDPEGVVGALNRVRELLVQSGQASVAVNGVHLQGTAAKGSRAPLGLDLDKARRRLGFEFGRDEALQALGRLGFATAEAGGEIKVQAPSWRFDIEREEDLIEDIGRVLGYERIPEVLPTGTVTGGGVKGIYGWHDQLIERCLELSLNQAMTHSLCGDHPLNCPNSERAALRSPGSPDLAFMRASLLPGLAESVRRNGGTCPPFFELGPIFAMKEGKPITRKALAVIAPGPLDAANRRGDAVRSADFFWLKAILEDLFGTIEVAPSEDCRLHPTRQAKLVNGRGIFGQLHPLIAEQLDLPLGTVVAEVVLEEALIGLKKVSYHQLSRTPSIRRDIAFAVSKSVPYSSIEEVIHRAAGDLLEDLWLFDVYEGKGITEGEHSLAAALTLRKQGSTFTDEEANQVRDAVVAGLAAIGAKQR